MILLTTISEHYKLIKDPGMRMLRNYAVFIVLLSVLVACKKERSFEDPRSTPIINRQWQFNEAGSTFSGPMDSGYIRTIGVANSLSMSGTSTDGKGTISLQILSTGAITRGDYKNPQVLFQYSQNGSSIFQSSNTDNFTITIISIDSLSVTGTFSGIITDSSANKQTISEGKFTALLSGVAPAPIGKGQLTVWSKQLCGGGGSIFIKVGDSTGAITIASATQPDCGAAGTATFNLPAGEYTLTAVCGTDTLTGNVSILPGACTTLEVDLSQLANRDYFPLLSQWTYGNVNNDTLAISSIGDTSIETTPGNFQIYTRFFNDKTLFTNYYRKQNGIYYQYLFAGFGNTLDSPVEIKILDDSAPAGTSWESDPYQITPNTAPAHTFTFKLSSQITNAGFSQVINGINYNNLIEVTYSLLIQNPVTRQYSDSGNPPVVIIFAKGIGIVSYQDFDNNGNEVDWGIRHYNVRF